MANTQLKEVTIERDLIIKMSQDPKFQELLPPLKILNLQSKQRKKKSRCTPCGRKQRPSYTQQSIDDAKRGIAHLSPDIHARLKGMLGASVVRIKYAKGDKSGTIVKKF